MNHTWTRLRPGIDEPEHMNDTFTTKDAHILLQQALTEPLGLLVWSDDPVAFAQVLYRARREDPTLQGIKILNIPEGTAICHEPSEVSWPADQ